MAAGSLAPRMPVASGASSRKRGMGVSVELGASAFAAMDETHREAQNTNWPPTWNLVHMG